MRSFIQACDQWLICNFTGHVFEFDFTEFNKAVGVDVTRVTYNFTWSHFQVQPPRKKYPDPQRHWFVPPTCVSLNKKRIESYIVSLIPTPYPESYEVWGTIWCDCSLFKSRKMIHLKSGRKTSDLSKNFFSKLFWKKKLNPHLRLRFGPAH